MNNSIRKKSSNKGNSLPSYIVNLDELADILYNNLLNSHNEIEVTKQSKGLKLELTSNIVYEAKYLFEKKALITGIRFGVERCRNIGYIDSWDMYIDDELIMSDIYVKEMYEYKQFKNFSLIKAGQAVKFVFHNRSRIKKNVWFDIDFII